MKKYNFNAGPSMLPREVIENTAKQILDFNGSGLSLMEISHRAKDFQPVVDEAVSLFKELLDIPEGSDIHAATAAKIWHEDIKEVTDAQRKKAKTANFGIIVNLIHIVSIQDTTIELDNGEFLPSSLARIKELKLLLQKIWRNSL